MTDRDNTLPNCRSRESCSSQRRWARCAGGDSAEVQMTASAEVRYVPNLISAGTPAPEFTLHATPDQVVRLSEFRSRRVIPALHPAAWAPR